VDNHPQQLKTQADPIFAVPWHLTVRGGNHIRSALVLGFSGVVFGGLICLAGLGLASCKSPPPANQPGWISEPKSDDSIYLYRVGHAARQSSPDAAREAAFQDAVRQIMGMFNLAGAPGNAQLLNRFIAGKVELVPGCVWIEKDDGRCEGWVQVSWPLAEKQQVLKRLALGEELTRRWSQAQEALRRGEAAKARTLLDDLLKRQDQALFLPLDLDQVKLTLGDINREQREMVEARALYESVANLSTSAAARKVAIEKIRLLPDPPRFWPMRERWAGQKVALLCAIRDGKECRRFLDLTNLLTKDCGEARLTSVDIAGALDAAAMAVFFDAMNFAAAQEAAGKGGAALILGVLFDTDPAKRGTKTVNLGVEVPAPDSVVRFFVVRVADGKLLYNGQFREIAGTSPEPRLADHAAAILVTRYLVPNCPLVPAPAPEPPVSNKETQTAK
jgi:hypothetical protein